MIRFYLNKLCNRVRRHLLVDCRVMVGTEKHKIGRTIYVTTGWLLVPSWSIGTLGDDVGNLANKGLVVVVRCFDNKRFPATGKCTSRTGPAPDDELCFVRNSHDPRCFLLEMTDFLQPILLECGREGQRESVPGAKRRTRAMMAGLAEHVSSFDEFSRVRTADVAMCEEAHGCHCWLVQQCGLRQRCRDNVVATQSS